MIEAPPLDFTAHCQVRYIERFLDKDAVIEARRDARSDAAVLDLLRPEFEDELRHFRHILQVGYFHLLHKVGSFVKGTPYRLNLGVLSACIEGNLCKTIICKHHALARPEPPDDDPMEEKIVSQGSQLAA